MASSKEDGIAAAAKPIGSMSLNRSAERNDENTRPTAKNWTTTTKFCSACDKKSDTAMKCRACKCVWYCDKECQNKHWKEHRKECKLIKKELDKRGGKLDLGEERYCEKKCQKRHRKEHRKECKRGGKLDLGEELDVGPPGKLPPQEECPICMCIMPIRAKLQSYASCCGKMICCGCDFQHMMKSRDRGETCAFCRTAVPKSDEELLARLHKRVELRDPDALVHMAMHYGEGGLELPVDQAKSIDLLRQSSDLGFPGAQHALGCYYNNGEMGLEQNEEEALKYWKKAAEGGHLISLHNLGCEEDGRGDDVAAMRHWRLSASEGFRDSMTNLIICFEDGFLHHADLAESLQTFYRARAEMKSEGRDQYIKHLKKTGEYKEHHDY